MIWRFRLAILCVCLSYGLAFAQAERLGHVAATYVGAIKTRISQLVDSPILGYRQDMPSGKVVLRLRINNQGMLKDMQVKESSGSADLDAIAAEIVDRVFPFIPFPLEMKQPEILVDIPLIFGEEKKITAPPEVTFSQPAVSAAKPEAAYQSRLQDCLRIALGNYLHSKVAREQVDLAQLKIKETERGLYPGLTGEYKSSDGKTITDPYRSISYGLQAEQLLVGLEQIQDAVQRDKIGLDMAKKNYERLNHNIRYEVTKVYYELVSQQMLHKMWQETLEGLNPDMELIKKLYDAGLTIPADYENAQSQYKLILHQADTAESNVSLAKLSLLQAMNLETSKLDQINVPAEFDFKPQDFNIDFYRMVNKGIASRPEIAVWKMTADSARINELISIKDNKPKLTVSTSYGRSGEAFSNQRLDMVNEWSLMGKLSWLWGPSSMESSLTQDRTLPKNITDTTLKTRAFTSDVKFSLLDKLNYYTTRKEASITYHQSLTELNDTRKKIIFEIKEAYLAYKRSISGIQASLNRVEFREREFKVIKAKTDVGEGSPLELLEAKINLSNDKAAYLRSLGEYYLALAALDKAAGYQLNASS